eukprot:30294-Pelagococcus_subviridis.AAC.90
MLQASSSGASEIWRLVSTKHPSSSSLHPPAARDVPPPPGASLSRILHRVRGHGDDRNRAVRVQFPNLLRALHPAHPRHVEVHQDEIERIQTVRKRSEVLDNLDAVLAQGDVLVPAPREHRARDFHVDVMILREKNPQVLRNRRRFRVRAAAARGSRRAFPAVASIARVLHRLLHDFRVVRAEEILNLFVHGRLPVRVRSVAAARADRVIPAVALLQRADVAPAADVVRGARLHRPRHQDHRRAIPRAPGGPLAHVPRAAAVLLHELIVPRSPPSNRAGELLVLLRDDDRVRTRGRALARGRAVVQSLHDFVPGRHRGDDDAPPRHRLSQGLSNHRARVVQQDVDRGVLGSVLERDRRRHALRRFVLGRVRAARSHAATSDRFLLRLRLLRFCASRNALANVARSPRVLARDRVAPNVESERAAAAETWGLCPHPSPHRLAKALADRQAESRAVVFSRRGEIDLLERVEDPAHVAAVQADAGVSDVKLKRPSRGVIALALLGGDGGSRASV